MNGQSLLHVFDSAYLIALGTWLGSTLFSLFGVMPIVRRHQADALTTLEASVWSRCAVWGAVCGAVALPSLVCGALGMPELRGLRVGIQSVLLLIAILIMLYAGNVLTRRLVAQSREPVLADAAKRQIHTCYSFVAILLVLLMASHAYRATTATSGIVEPHPATYYHEVQTRMRDANQAMWNQYWEKQKKTQGTPSADAGDAARTPPQGDTP